MSYLLVSVRPYAVLVFIVGYVITWVFLWEVNQAFGNMDGRRQ
jgi:uncharacterized membrane protein (DUF485 family)